MKIGFLRRGHSSTGGAEAYLLRLAEGMRALGQETTLITSEEWPADRWPHGEIIKIPGKTPDEFAAAFDKTQTGCDVPFSLERVPGCDVFRAGDGVHAAWLQRRNAFEPFWKRVTRGLNRKHAQILRLERRVYDPDNTSVIIANSRMVRDEILAHFSYPAERVHVVYNGITRFPALPERSLARQKGNIRPTDFGPLFLGTGWERKGLKTAIRAVEMIEDCTLLVAGRGPADFYASRSAQFLGPVSDIASLFAAADLLVLPTWYDPFSNACLEALAAGLPVITSDANGFSEIISEEVHGQTIPAGDPLALANALESWRDRDRLENARSNCMELASVYSMEKNARDTLEILKSLMTQKNGLS